jgi:predicted nucleic acid-binding protein
VKVVSNSGPLMALGKIGQIQLLNSLYGVVWIPAAVYEETVEHGLILGQPDAIAIASAFEQKNLHRVELSEQKMSAVVASLPLDRGEKQAIELALIENADQVLLDDLAAREAAKKLGLKVKGTLGVLVEAVRKRFLSESEMDFIFNALLKRDDIWISKALIQSVAKELKRELRANE